MTILDQLRILGRRLLLIGSGAGVCLGLAASVLLVLAGVWLDLVWELPAWLRIGCLVLGVMVGLAVLAYQVSKAMRGREPRHIARRLDRAGQAGGRVLAGVDLALEPTFVSPISAGLANMAIADADRLARNVAPSQVVPARPLLRSMAVLAGLALAVFALWTALPDLALAQWLRFADPFGDHPPYSRVRFTVDPGDVTVPYGSGLDIKVTIEGEAVERASLVLLDPASGAEETLPMFPEANQRWRGTLTQVTAPRCYWIRTLAGRSHRFQITVATVPRLESVRFRITPPAYANLGKYEGPLPQGGLAGLPGTEVLVRARSNRPLSGGELHVRGTGEKIALAPDPAERHEVTGQFTIRKPGQLEVRIVDVDGQPATDVFQAPILVLTDERPFVRLLDPPAMSLATPTSALPVVISGEDDYGIARLQLFRSLNDSRAMPFDIELPAQPPVRWTASLVLPLSAYGLEPGDEIKLFARVEDNDPAGAKGFESPLAVIRIISQEEFERMVRVRQGLAVLMAKYRQAQRRLETLADDVDRLRKKNKDPKRSPEVQDELEKLARKMKQDAEALRKASRQPFPYDIDQEMTKHLARQAQELEELAEQVERLTRDKELAGPKLDEELARLFDKLGKNREQLDRETMQPLERLQEVYPLIEAASRFIELYLRQRALAERLASLQDKESTNDPALRARMRDQQAEQQSIRKALQELLEDLEEHATKLPDRPELEELKKSVTDFVAKVRASGAAEAMTDAEAGLAEFNGKRGHAGALKAADILEKLIEMCEGGNGLIGQGLARLRFQPGIGKTVQQLLDEAGLSTGRGQGSGGSSQRSNSMDNVGLFGNLPALGESAGDGSSPRGQGSGNQQGGSVRDWSRPAAGDSTRTPATGAADTSVPLPYRRRVADYFQRLAEELGK